MRAVCECNRDYVSSWLDSLIFMRNIRILCNLQFISSFYLSLSSAGNMSGYKRKSKRKLIFTQEVLNDCYRRLRDGESKRKIAESLGINESTLRKRIKAVSTFG